MPDYSTLFGSLGLCDCEHCQSLYSPAAYFVDILRFLDGGPRNADGMNPLQVLLDRRPDIEQIELTCENTNTQLPYVDLASEVFEAAMVPRWFEIAEDTSIGGVLAALGARQIPAWIRTAFAGRGYALSDKASLRIDREGRNQVASKWIIVDGGWAFSLKHMGTHEGFEAVAWPQTSWTADELKAHPEHVHEPAYALLQSAVYPWNLPISVPLEEMRSYLGHLGVGRHELMETLFAGASADAVSDKSIALEHLGMTAQEADIISGVTTGGPRGGPASGRPLGFLGAAPVEGTTSSTGPTARRRTPRATGTSCCSASRFSCSNPA